MTTIKLTGATRYRPLRQWRRETVLVLQVQETVEYDHLPPPGSPRHFKRWRDARVEDLTVVVEVAPPPPADWDNKRAL